MRFVAGGGAVLAGSRSGALSDDFKPDFNVVLLVDVGDDTFFLATLVDAVDGVGFGSEAVDRRLGGKKQIIKRIFPMEINNYFLIKINIPIPARIAITKRTIPAITPIIISVRKTNYLE